MRQDRRSRGWTSPATWSKPLFLPAKCSGTAAAPVRCINRTAVGCPAGQPAQRLTQSARIGAPGFGGAEVIDQYQPLPHFRYRAQQLVGQELHIRPDTVQKCHRRNPLNQTERVIGDNHCGPALRKARQIVVLQVHRYIEAPQHLIGKTGPRLCGHAEPNLRSQCHGRLNAR